MRRYVKCKSFGCIAASAWISKNITAWRPWKRPVAGGGTTTRARLSRTVWSELAAVYPIELVKPSGDGCCPNRENLRAINEASEGTAASVRLQLVRAPS